MGCAQSKIENEEAVTRCKERKLLMKDAVTARNAFAAAHSAYAMALKNTGAALSDYSHGEFLVSNHSSSSAAAAAIASTSSLPTDLSPPPPTSSAAVSNSAASSSSSAAATTIPQPIPDTLPPPPPPPPLPLQRAATMPEMNGRSGVGGPSGNGLNGIEEDGALDNDDDDDSELENHDRLIRKSRSRGGSTRTRNTVEDHHHLEEKAPPPPPPAENSRPIPPPRQHQHQHQQQQEPPFYDYFFSGVEHMPGTTLEDTPPQPQQPQVITKPEPPRPHSPVTEYEEEEEEDDDDDDEEEEEEVETVVERKAPVEERPKRVEEVSVELEKATNLRGMKKSKVMGMAGERRGGRVSMANLANVFNEIDDNFLRASESAHEVSKMLEATRLHYHSNFADNRGDLIDSYQPIL